MEQSVYLDLLNVITKLTTLMDHGSDEENCVEECSEDEFMCKNGQKCIPNRYICDRDLDCFDGTDQENCEEEQDLSDDYYNYYNYYSENPFENSGNDDPFEVSGNDNPFEISGNDNPF